MKNYFITFYPRFILLLLTLFVINSCSSDDGQEGNENIPPRDVNIEINSVNSSIFTSSSVLEAKLFLIDGSGEILVQQDAQSNVQVLSAKEVRSEKVSLVMARMIDFTVFTGGKKTLLIDQYDDVPDGLKIVVPKSENTLPLFANISLVNLEDAFFEACVQNVRPIPIGGGEIQFPISWHPELDFAYMCIGNWMLEGKKYIWIDKPIEGETYKFDYNELPEVEVDRNLSLEKEVFNQGLTLQGFNNQDYSKPTTLMSGYQTRGDERVLNVVLPPFTFDEYKLNVYFQTVDAGYDLIYLDEEIPSLETFPKMLLTYQNLNKDQIDFLSHAEEYDIYTAHFQTIFGGPQESDPVQYNIHGIASDEGSASVSKAVFDEMTKDHVEFSYDAINFFSTSLIKSSNGKDLEKHVISETFAREGFVSSKINIRQ